MPTRRAATLEQWSEIRPAFLSFGIDRQQSVIFDILIDKAHNQRLTDHGSPITDVMVRTGPETIHLVVSVTLGSTRYSTDQHAGQVVRLEFVPQIAQRLERYAATPGRRSGFGGGGSCRSSRSSQDIPPPRNSAAGVLRRHIELSGVRHGFAEQQLADSPLLGHRLSLHELLQLLNILITIKGKAVSFRRRRVPHALFLIISLQDLGIP